MHKLKSLLRLLDKHTFFIALSISLLYALAGSIVSVIRFWQYEVFFYDFGIFDKAIWSVSQFSVPIIDHMVLGEKIIFADHFSPSIFLLSPLFWIFPFSETLLVTQAVIVAASGFILFLIGKQVLKHNMYAIALMIMYFLFVGLQNAVITDFHEVTIATLAFMLTFFAIVKKNKKLYFISLFILLGFKETLFLMGIGIAIALFFLQPTWRKIALITFFISLIWGVIAIKVIIPFFSGGTYLYSTQLAGNPLTIIASLFDEPAKRNTLFYSFLSFGFLPVLSPPFWFLLVQDFLIRFYGEFSTRWGLGFHYSALTAAIMAVSSVYSLQFLRRYLKKTMITILVIGLLLNSLILYRVILDGPFALAYNPAFYSHTKNFDYLDEVVAKIPKDASIMTQNNLVTHFTHQQAWHLVSDVKAYGGEYYKTKRPDYILIDNRSGQNPNNYFGVKDMDTLLNNLQKDTDYEMIDKQGDIMIFKRK